MQWMQLPPYNCHLNTMKEYTIFSLGCKDLYNGSCNDVQQFIVNEGKNTTGKFMFNLFKRSRNFPSKYNQQLYFVPESFPKVQVIQLTYRLYTIHLQLMEEREYR